MKNKAQVMEQRSRIEKLDWLYLDTQEEDFLMGKTPKDLPEIWEDEE